MLLTLVTMIVKLKRKQKTNQPTNQTKPNQTSKQTERKYTLDLDFNAIYNGKKEFFLLHLLHSQNLGFINALHMNWFFFVLAIFLLLPLFFKLKGILKLSKI